MKKSAVKKGFAIAAYVLVCVVILFFAFILYSNLSGQTVFLFGHSAMWVKTESMSPTIPAQTYILVQQIDPDEVKVGDVIVFTSDDPTLHGALNTHRVTAISEDGREFTTKGDHNPGEDNYTAKADKLLGVYRGNLPFLTMAGRFLATAAGITVTMGLILLIMLAVYLPDVVAAFHKEDPDKADKDAAARQAQIDALVRAEVEKLKAEEDQDPDHT